MQKKIKISLIVLTVSVIIIGTVSWFSRDFLKENLFNKNRQSAEQQELLAQQEKEGKETEQTRLGNPVVKTAKIKESTDNYEISLKYPKLSEISNAQAMNNINAVLKNKMQKLAGDFKKDVAENAPKELGSKSALSNIYDVGFFTNDIISVRFNTLYSIAGGETKNYEDSFNYNLKDNKEIKLAELFNLGSNYFAKLSAISYESLNKQLAKTNYYSSEAISLGTRSIESNFINFFITKSMLVIIINAGQVTPSGTGIRYVDIPWTQMADVNNNSDLAQIIIK